jgi:hypothetical protein
MPDDFENEFIGRWSQTEDLLWTDAFGNQFEDTTAQALFHAAYFDQSYETDERVQIRRALDEYLKDEYDIEFDEVFDWEAWRESYGETAGAV